MDPYAIIHHPLSTEKSVRLLQAENKLVFVVAPHAARNEIKAAVEQLFKVKVTGVNVLNTARGEKRAYVTLDKGSPAIEVATDLGLM